jgi:transposase
MPRPLSDDLRKRVVAHQKETGVGRITLGKRFQIGSATAYRWVEEAALGLGPKLQKKRGVPPKIPNEKLDALALLVAEKSDRTLQELCTEWKKQHDVDLNVATMHRALARAKITLKKKTKRIVHRTREDVLKAKSEFYEKVTKVPKEKLVFLDEMGVNRSMTPTMARAPIGERAFGTVPSIRSKNTSTVGAFRGEEVLARVSQEEAFNGKSFCAFLEVHLVPKLQKGDVVVMDNVRFHKGDAVKKIIEDAGASLMFVPAYHPELNAIEEAFSVVKRAVRRLEPRDTESVMKAISVGFALLGGHKLVAFTDHMLSFAIQGL